MVGIKKCDSCLNSRIVVSENGLHSICCLSEKKAVACMLGKKDSYLEYRGKGFDFQKEEGGAE